MANIKNERNKIKSAISGKDVQESLKVLFISNSFGYNTAEYIHSICEAEDKNMLVGNLYIAGGSLENHVDHLTNNNNVYQYRIRACVNGVIEASMDENYTIDKGIDMEDWDYVIFNQSSGDSGIYSTFQPYLNNLISHVKRKLPHVKIGLMPTWAYFSDFANPTLHLNHQERLERYNDDQMTMYGMILDAYNEAMEDIDFDLIIPSATSIQNARTNDYMKGLDYELTIDGYHLNETGMYIAGLTLFQSIFKCRVKSDYIPPNVSKKAAGYSKLAVNNAVINPFALTII